MAGHSKVAMAGGEVPDSARLKLRLPRGGNWFYFQDAMLKNSLPDSFRVVFDKKKWCNIKREWKIVKVFGAYPTPRSFLENLDKDGAANWGYEFITAGRRCNAFLDIEWYAVPDCDHVAIREIVKIFRQALKDKLGIDQAEIHVWRGSRETVKGYKNSYHVHTPSLHAASNKDFKCLIDEIWPNGFFVPGVAKNLIDTSVYDPNSSLRLPGCAKQGETVVLTLISKDPYDSSDLSPVAIPDVDFKMAERSLLTVIDQDSTLLDLRKLTNCKALFKSGKRGRDEGEQDPGRTPRRARVEQPHIDDSAAVSPGTVEDVALTLAMTHPRIGSGYDAWFRTLCAILNVAGRQPGVELLAVEYSRIRESYKGAADVESHLRGLQLRGSGGTKVLIGSIKKLASENRALVFKKTARASGLGHVDGVGVNKTWVNILDQVFRWADTEVVWWEWMVQCAAYIAPLAEIQTRAWVKQYYPDVKDKAFKTIWCLQTRSTYYEKALKTYILSALDEMGAPQGKRARRDSGSDGGGVWGQPKAVWPEPNSMAPHRGVGDGCGAGSGYTGAGASSMVRVGNENSPCLTEDDMGSSGGAEPVVQDYERTRIVQDAVPTFQDSDAMVQDSDETVQDTYAMVQDSDVTPPAPDAACPEAAAAISCASITALAPRTLPTPPPTTAAARPRRPAAAAPVVETESDAESVCQDGEPVCQDGEPVVRACDFNNLSKDNLDRVTTKIHEKYLHAGMIDPRKYFYGGSGYKTAKTTMAHEYIKTHNLPVLSIVNLRSLKDGVLEKFADCDILSYEDKKLFYEQYTPGRSVVITLDSLMMLEEVDFKAKDYVVFIDEIHSLMVYLTSSTTLADKRILIWPFFARILKNCKQIIAVDNDICDVAMDFILNTIQRNHPYKFVMNSFKSYGGESPVSATEVPKMKDMTTLMYRHILDDEKFTACFNERRQAEQVFQDLKARCEKDGMDHAKMKLFTGTEGERITDIQKQWDDYYVFYSPIIVTGRDYNPDVPTTTFSFTRGTKTLSPEESVQQLARNRNMKHLYWHMENVGVVEPLFKTEADIKECFRNEKTALKAMTVYREVCNKQVSACGDACDMGENVFTESVVKVAHRRHLMECDFRYHFIKILQNTGFRVEESSGGTVGFGEKEVKILDQRISEEKERKIEAFLVKVRDDVPMSSDDVFEKTALRRAEILQLPMDESVIRDYKEEVFDDKAFQHHLNFRRLTKSKTVFGDEFNAFVNGDNSFNATQTNFMKVYIFCDIIKKCAPECGSVLELQVSVGSKDAVPIPEGVLKLWKVLTREKQTKIPKNKKKLIQSVLDLSKSLFGRDFLDTEYKQPRRGGKKHSESCYTVNPEWRKRQMDLLWYSARSHEGNLDIELMRRYGLCLPIDYANPNTDEDVTNQIHVCELVECIKTPEDSELEQERSKAWADLAQTSTERVCASTQKTATPKPDPWSRPHRVSVVTPSDSTSTLHASEQKKAKRAPVNEEERRKRLRSQYARCGVQVDF